MNFLTNIEQLPDFPHELIDQSTSKRINSKPKKDWNEILSKEYPEGSRNDSSVQVAGKLLHHLPEDLWDPLGWDSFKAYNQEHNNPPLDENELKAKWEGIKKAEREQKVNDTGVIEIQQSGSQTGLLLQLLESLEKEGHIQYFHNEKQEPFVKALINNNYLILQCKSKRLIMHLSKLFWDKFKKPINQEGLSSVIRIIEAKACFGDSQHKLFNRIARHQGAILYDLSDEKNRAVKITSEGWEIIDNPPILFKRHSHQQPQSEPSLNGDVRNFLKFVNIKDENHEILLLVWLISCFIPDFPHPVLNIYGPQGSAKSSLLKLLKRLIDPSCIELTSLKGDHAELTQLLYHHWFIPFDNVSALKVNCSDILCRAVTGDGFSKRELYSDDEDVIYNIKRCIGINGINLATTKPDLLERSILLELARITPTDRKEEQEILEEFEKERPGILGNIFTIVSKAMKIKPLVKLSSRPRMADFASWGAAISEALGYGTSEFLNAYGVNIKEQNQEVLNESVVAQVLITFMEKRLGWIGTTSELLDSLRVQAISLKIDTAQRGWPKSEAALGKVLNSLKANLEEEGIVFSKTYENRSRIITIKKINKTPVVPVATVAEAPEEYDILPVCNSSNGCNSKNPSSEEEGDPYAKYKDDIE